MRLEPASRNANRKRVLCVHAASFHAFVAENALRIVAHVEFVVDLWRLFNRRYPRAEFLHMRAVSFLVRLKLRRGRNIHRRRKKLKHDPAATAKTPRICTTFHT